MGRDTEIFNEAGLGWVAHSKPADPKLAFESLPSGVHRESPSGATPEDGGIPQRHPSWSIQGLGYSLLPTPCDLEEATHIFSLPQLPHHEIRGTCVATQNWR